jgi:hypothetical protein
MPNEILNCLSDTLDMTFVNRRLVCALPAVSPSGECDEASALEKKVSKGFHVVCEWIGRSKTLFNQLD